MSHGDPLSIGTVDMNMQFREVQIHCHGMAKSKKIQGFVSLLMWPYKDFWLQNI